MGFGHASNGSFSFLTASRAGFIDLVIAGTVCLWHFGVKGKRPYLIVVALLLGALLMAVAGRQLKDRFTAMSGEDLNTSIEGKAYTSFEARQMLMRRAVEGIEHYPILGVGVNNFMSLSGDWHEVHMTYLELRSRGAFFRCPVYSCSSTGDFQTFENYGASETSTLKAHYSREPCIVR